MTSDDSSVPAAAALLAAFAAIAIAMALEADAERTTMLAAGLYLLAGVGYALVGWQARPRARPAWWAVGSVIAAAAVVSLADVAGAGTVGPAATVVILAPVAGLLTHIGAKIRQARAV